MRKLFLVIMCLALASLMLVGCAEDVIGEYIDQYDAPVPKEKLSYNLYIICDDATTENAKVTVRQRIADYTSDKFLTTVNVVYCSEAEYSAKILEKTVADATDRADIFLINSESLIKELYSLGRLADLTEFFAGKTYGTLNAQIASSLLETSLITETEGNKTVSKNYCVPNNHIVGNYEYLIIHRDTAERYYQGSETQLAAFNTYESTSDLRALIEADIAGGNLTGTVDNYVKLITDGMYEDKASYEASGYWCNIVKNPESSVAQSFSSAFAINASVADVNRAMEIVYAINTDETLRNYLQYGIVGTNYNVDEETGSVIRVQEGNSVYHMNPIYTGDIFKMLYCEELGWTAISAQNGLTQNLASKAPEKQNDTQEG